VSIGRAKPPVARSARPHQRSLRTPSASARPAAKPAKRIKKIGDVAQPERAAASVGPAQRPGPAVDLQPSSPVRARMPTKE